MAISLVGGGRPFIKTLIMQQGKNILTVAAVIVTASSAFSFKTSNKFTAGHKLWVQVFNNVGGNFACVTCRSVGTKAVSGVNIASCQTIINGLKVQARNKKTYFTLNTAGKINCMHPWTKVQLSL